MPSQSEVMQATQKAKTYDAYYSSIQAALSESAGFEREKLSAQLQDAAAGRENAWKIANLQAKTQRYGIDKNYDAEMKRLTELQRQFDLNHGLELEKFGFEKEKFGKEFGLETAKAYTQFSQTPDMVWALNDFKTGLGRAGLGMAPQSVATSETQPHAKTWEDFAALAGFGNLPGVQAGQTGQAGTAATGQAGSAGTGTDQRVTAANAVMKALPPSESPGTDQQDWAALNAIRSLYFGRKPGQVERLGQARRGIAQAGLARLGYDPNLVEQDRKRSLPGQRAASAV